MTSWLSLFLLILCLEPHYKVAMLGVNTKEFFLKEKMLLKIEFSSQRRDLLTGHSLVSWLVVFSGNVSNVAF